MKTAQIFYRYENEEITRMISEAKVALKQHNFEIVKANPDLLIVIGGDGAMLEAARENCECKPLILGINAGTVGFLASINRDNSIEKAIEDIVKKNYKVIERFMVHATVKRTGKEVFSTYALNDIVITSPLSVVELAMTIDESPYLTLRGSGALVSTPTGSTAYNMAAHGPIMSPQARGMIVTELLDHNVPTPSLILGEKQSISIKIGKFRRHEQLQLTTGEPADVVLDADGAELFALQEGDQVIVHEAKHSANFVAFEEQDFFSQLRAKFDL